MKKHLPSRIFGLAALYCTVFFVLVIVQFSGKGNFTISANTMIIKGRYLNDNINVKSGESQPQLLTGGVRIFFGGIELSLKEERRNGLFLINTDGAITHINPESITVTGNTARLGLPGGSALVFNSTGSEKEPELQINAEFAQNILEVNIPIIPHRSIVRNDGQTGIMYNGSRYMFNGSGRELEINTVILSRGNSVVSYRSRGKQRSFDPSDFIIPQSQNYYFALSNWQDLSFTRWNQNAASLNNEDDIIGYLSEALRQNSYSAALASVPGNFTSSPQHTYKSATYLGGMVDAYRSFAAEENKKINTLNLLAKESPLDILKEEHIIDYLLIRGNTVLANDIIQLIQNTSPEKLIIDYCPGLLEAYSDIKRWYPSINNPVEPLTEQILLLISENLNKDTVSNLVYASGPKDRDLYYGVRLGNALINWAEDAKNIEWANIGHSLVLSALTNAGPGAGNLYGILKPGDYYPKPVLLADGLWAWTVSPSIRPFWSGGNLNITFSFPAGQAHYVILRGIKPFIKIQIHDMDWRTDSQFERYDSSGWVYYTQDQTLVLKLRHKSQAENIKIVYRYEAPPPAEDENSGDYFGW